MLNSKFKRIWAIPLLMAILIISGLLSALLGTGAWHVLSYILLSIPIGIFIVLPVYNKF